MPGKYSENLPQLTSEGFFLTDAGLETVMIFEEKQDLPQFAAFYLLRTPEGRKLLSEYSEKYVKLALVEIECDGFILETPTWRASSEWAQKIGVDRTELHKLISLAVRDAKELREKFGENKPIVISGAIGPRGDGYQPDKLMTPEESFEFHLAEIKVFSESGVDLISAATINHPQEAIGIARAGASLSLPVAIGFTVETDGTLPDGISLKEAIQMVDADCKPSYYMINCAHPEHFIHLFQGPKEDWHNRILAVRCNPSRKSHKELDEAEELDIGDPVEFGKINGQLKKKIPNLRIFGGCCGTSVEHIRQIGFTLKTF